MSSNLSKRRQKRKDKKAPTPGKIFIKMFGLTFLICTVLFTSGMGVFAAFMNSTPMDQSNNTIKAVSKTENDLDVLVPGEGLFTTRYTESQRVNILLYGTTDEGLADTIMLCSIDPLSKTATIISMPRDLYYPREGASGGYLKLNSVAHDGPLAVSKAVHELLQGIPINYYAMINYDGVKKIVDSVGGVPMTIEEPMKYTSKRQNLYIDIPEGEQVLDGEHAVQFLRFRSGYTDGDIGRVKAQQAFMKNAAKQAIGPNLPSLATTMAQNVDSLITPKALTYLAGSLKDMDFNKVTTYTYPGEGGYIDSLSFYLQSDDSVIEGMVRAIYEGRPFIIDDSAY